MNRPTAAQFFSVLAILVGVAVSYFPPPSNGAAIWALISGFLGYGARDLFGSGADSAPAAPVTDQTKQSGRALPGMLALLAACAALALSLTGCASQLQAVQAFNTSAMVSVRATADIAVDTSVASFCGMSIDTLSRHPEYVDAAVTLCLKNSTTPAGAALKSSITLTAPITSTTEVTK